MSEKRPPLSSYTIFLEACGLYARTSRQTLKLALLFIFLPQLAYFLGLSWLSGHYVTNRLSSSMLAEGIAPLADTAVNFFGFFFLSSLAALSLFLPALVGMLRLAIACYCEQRVMTLREALKTNRFLAVLVLTLLIALLSFLEQGIFGPFPVITMLAAMAYVIMLVERRGAFSALSQAVFLRYTSPTAGGAFGAFLILTTIAIFIFGAESTLAYLQGCLLRGDEILGLPRSIWAGRFFIFPFTYVHLLTTSAEIFVRALILSFLPSFCVCLYYAVRPKFSQRI